MSQGPLCPNLTQKVQMEVSQIANRNFLLVILLGGLSVNLNHRKTHMKKKDPRQFASVQRKLNEQNENVNRNQSNENDNDDDDSLPDIVFPNNNSDRDEEMIDLTEMRSSEDLFIDLTEDDRAADDGPADAMKKMT